MAATENAPATRNVRPPSERTLWVFADAWSHLVLREAFFGVRRFEQFQRNLGISRNVLSQRLKHLVANDVLERRRYQTRPERFEYRLTERGLDMYPIFIAIVRWGDRWLTQEEGPSLLLHHELCDHHSEPVMVCDHCREEIRAREMRYSTGPGAPGASASTERESAQGPR